jgi:predicted nuclease of restriction endonuclease-like (RecB) superfamily
MGQSKLPEERGLYLRLAVQTKWTTPELDHQIRTATFERTVLTVGPCQQSRHEMQLTP